MDNIKDVIIDGISIKDRVTSIYINVNKEYYPQSFKETLYLKIEQNPDKTSLEKYREYNTDEFSITYKHIVIDDYPYLKTIIWIPKEELNIIVIA